MRVILKPLSLAEGLCGRQEPSEETYRPAKHFISAECNDGVLLYHTLTKELLLLSDEEWKSPDEKTLRTLAEHWFRVPQTFDECEYADHVRQIAELCKKDDGKGITEFTILTTTDCNARCFYCYEKGQRRISMDEKTAHDTADFIAERCRGEEVKISWFGGEPLCNSKAIDIISEDLREKRIPFTSVMTSNGYLFDRELARRARESWNLRQVQITLDGTKDVYRRIKAYVDCADDPFDRVLGNIESLADEGIEVAIRLNMDAENAEDLKALCLTLGERFRGRNGLFAFPLLLKQFVGRVHEFEREELALERYYEIQRILEEQGIERKHILTRSFAANHCMADNDHAVCVMPNGKLGKCEHFDEGEWIGSIYDDRRDEARISAWKERIHFPDCMNCPLYPECINLKKCAWMKDGCSKIAQIAKTDKLRKQIIDEYEKRKDVCYENQRGLCSDRNR